MIQKKKHGPIYISLWISEAYLSNKINFASFDAVLNMRSLSVYIYVSMRSARFWIDFPAI